MNNSLTITALKGIPLIQQGDDLVTLILQAIEANGFVLQQHDVLVISSKIVSKSEGRLVDLRTVQPRPEAQHLAVETRKDPRIVELVLQESHAVSRKAPGTLVTRHRLGFVSANSGIDQSNVGLGDDFVLLLPLDPDHSANVLCERLSQVTNVHVGIIISDTHGRPFRLGNVGVAIGVAGMPAFVDLRGQQDLFGRELRVSTQGYADLVASAAHLVCGEAGEGLPVVLVRGLEFSDLSGKANDLYRPAEQDLYR